MRVNVYAEEMTDRIEIISKEIDGQEFTGLRFYLYLPVTLPDGKQAQGPFEHRPGDDDSAAVTFWGKRDMREVLKIAQAKLDAHYGEDYNGNLDWLKVAEDRNRLRDEVHELRIRHRQDMEMLEAQRDAFKARVTELEQQIVRMAAK